MDPLLDNIIITEDTAAAGIIHVANTMGMCGYRKWSFRKVREGMDKRKQREQIRRR